MKYHIMIGAAVLVVALAGQSNAVAAPTGIAGPVPNATLARAVRVAPPAPQTPPASPVLREMLDRVNAERSARGLAPMRYDERLVLAAQRHSDDQAGRRQMSHVGSDGSSLGVRVDRVGYRWRRIAENVASGHPDTASVMAGWMASDGHRRNILSANTDIGVGLAYSADGRPYWTQVFATPG